MELKKVQKNGPIISKLKEERQMVAQLREHIAANHNSRKTSIAVTLLEEVDHNLVDHMVELGMVMKLEEGNE